MISLYDLLEACNGQLFGEPHSQLFNGLSFDAAQAQAGHLFVAARTGNNLQDTMHQAVRHGATGLLTVTPPTFNTAGLSVILVRDLHAALLGWTRALLANNDGQFIVVAGECAQQTTVQALTHLLSRHKQQTAAAHGDLFSLAAALSRLHDEDYGLVVEWSPALAATLTELGNTLSPQVVVCAGATPDDQALHQLLASLAPEALVVADYATPLPPTRAPITTISIDSFGADWLALNVVSNLDGTGFDLRHNQSRWLGRWTHLLGSVQLRALLRALVAAHACGVGVDEGLRVLRDIEPLPGYLHPLAGMNGATIVDSSATATLPDALASLDWLATIRTHNRRTVAIVGELAPSSQPRAAGYRTLGLRAAQAADYLLTEGADAAQAARAALDTGMAEQNLVITYSASQLFDGFQRRVTLTPDDVVIVIGGRAAGLDRLIPQLAASPEGVAPETGGGVPSEPFALSQQTRPSRVEIDLDALAHNVQRLKAMVGPGVVLTAVVKADAYGSGAVAVTRTALRNGARYVAVASLGEALELRDAGIDAPILVMSYTAPAAIRHAVRHNITVTIFDHDLARAYDQMAAAAGGTLRVHLKIDTGMGRLGLSPQDSVTVFRHLLGMHHLKIEGVYTHFASADEDPAYTAEQARIFMDVVKPLRDSGHAPRYVHASNSAATLAFPAYHYNMVRVGLAMHGLSPSEMARVPDDFRPVMRWKTFVAQLKTLPDGHSVGYGQTYVCEGEQRIAILPIGYADGFRRGPTNAGEVLIGGRRAPVIGRVSMEKTAVLVSHLPNVMTGDEVVVIGEQGSERISADEVAARWGTISYEVLCSALARQPRA